MFQESGDYEVLLIGEMPLQQVQKQLYVLSEEVGSLSFVASPSREGGQQCPCMLDGRLNAFMNDLVIGFEEIEAGDHAPIQLPKLRKVHVIFDPVMLIEVLQEGIEPRNEGLLQV